MGTEVDFRRPPPTQRALLHPADPQANGRWHSVFPDDGLWLVRWLHRGGVVGYWWYQAGTRSEWYEETVPKLPTGKNIYWNVHPVAAIPTRGPDPVRLRATVEEVTAVNCLFAEFDAKDFGDSLQATLDHLRGLPLQPSAIIFSGHGYQAYWLLREPLELDTPELRDQAKRRQAQWVQMFGGDSGAKDLARVLRVPDTINAKPGMPPVMARVESADGPVYSVEEIDAQFGADVSAPPSAEAAGPEKLPIGQQLSLANKALAMLKPERADDYDDWLAVGMSLRQLGDDGLALWDMWSRQSAKFQPGKCAEKWRSFSAGEHGGLTLGSLVHWAEQDSGHRIIRPGKRGAKPSEYIAALTAMGHRFSLNTMNDDVYVSGLPESDIVRSTLFTQLREHGYNNVLVAEDAWRDEASRHPFHPVQDYLNSLSWDGQDYIARLCSYFDKGANTAFNRFFFRWTIGAVARAKAGPSGTQSRVLVLEGAQDLGKSYFVRWLCSPLPAFFKESSIDPDNKDSFLRLAAIWLWEIAELGGTTRRADREALKNFFSTQTISERPPYGRRDIKKPCISAFIATVNPDVGFLQDPTGYRRFMIATVDQLDWGYANAIDVNQLWAQAVHLYRMGEAWDLTDEEKAQAEQASKDHELEDPIKHSILQLYQFDPSFDRPVSTTEIMLQLQWNGLVRGEVNLANRVGAILIGLRATKCTFNFNGGRVRGWKGLKRLSGDAPPVSSQMALPEGSNQGTPVDVTRPQWGR